MAKKRGGEEAVVKEASIKTAAKHLRAAGHKSMATRLEGNLKAKRGTKR